MKVSVIMPHSRPQFLQRAVHQFRNQTYPDTELIVVGDTEGSVPGITWVNGRGANIGAKRNIGCRSATGEIILHMDDDDYYSPEWIALSVDALVSSGATLTGLRRVPFYDPSLRKAWTYVYPVKGKKWVAGATMCYFRQRWEALKFREIRSGEDNHFCFDGGKICSHGNEEHFAAMIHTGNTSPKHTDHGDWVKMPYAEMERRLAAFEHLVK